MRCDVEGDRIRLRCGGCFEFEGDVKRIWSLEAGERAPSANRVMWFVWGISASIAGRRRNGHWANSLRIGGRCRKAFWAQQSSVLWGASDRRGGLNVEVAWIGGVLIVNLLFFCSIGQ